MCSRNKTKVNRMIKTSILFVISIIFLVIAYGFKRAHKTDREQIDSYKQTHATIERAIFSDTGNVKYYVSFFEDGNKITAQTDHYTSETKSLNPGDEVKIGYFFTKNGAPRAVILDEHVIPVSNSAPAFYKGCFVIGTVLLLVAVILLVRVMVF